LDKKYLEELLYWFGLGDGRHGVSEEFYEKRDIFSTSERMIDDFSEIAFKCGYSTRKFCRQDTEDYTFADRTIKAENKKPLYYLKILNTNGIHLDDRFMKRDKVKYNDYVYCLRVENETFYVRNKNSVAFWTGNCADINPDKIAILTTDLEWKGNDLYGKSKVLDTPMGKIASTLIKEGKIGVSSRGLGTVDESTGYVNEDYNLITWDLVTDPSNNPSWVNGIYEGKEFIMPNENDLSIKKAKEYHKKQIWQVLEKIEKSL
jgi:hypothetical protein